MRTKISGPVCTKCYQRQLRTWFQISGIMTVCMLIVLSWHHLKGDQEEAFEEEARDDLKYNIYLDVYVLNPERYRVFCAHLATSWHFVDDVELNVLRCGTWCPQMWSLMSSDVELNVLRCGAWCPKMWSLMSSDVGLDVLRCRVDVLRCGA